MNAKLTGHPLTGSMSSNVPILIPMIALWYVIGASVTCLIELGLYYGSEVSLMLGMHGLVASELSSRFK